MFGQLGLIGCGLMGGSFALACRRAGLVQRVVGYSASPASTARARQLGVIDAEAASAREAAEGADLVLLAVPVAATGATLAAIRPAVTAQTLIMDVGSTKGDVVHAAQQALQGLCTRFVPAHPIAGREVAGVEHADARLYQGARVILTPTAQTDTAALQRAEGLWTALGCHVQRMAPEVHDAAFAAVSHLPHLLAFAMMGSIAAQPHAQALLSVAGPGFRDFTRIAAAEPQLWRDVLRANRDEVLAQAQHFRQALSELESALQAGDGGDALLALIAQASEQRAQWRPGGADSLKDD
ncbi:prephenate dehydrogenase/arogenate dehydrogenase family protein [Melaminivora sp.]|uniref:prephenate dehydrogenase n=1 Tax=Melaminivora sp. TaxID=1933032 RepID=UPI0028A670E3|nr:prephenate dehydrogenase/arogenate dehydrogenase family protein [Melaminivora sp.]